MASDPYFIKLLQLNAAQITYLAWLTCVKREELTAMSQLQSVNIKPWETYRSILYHYKRHMLNHLDISPGTINSLIIANPRFYEQPCPPPPPPPQPSNPWGSPWGGRKRNTYRKKQKQKKKRRQAEN